MCSITSEVILCICFALYSISWNSLAVCGAQELDSRQSLPPKHLPYPKWLEGPQVKLLEVEPGSPPRHLLGLGLWLPRGRPSTGFPAWSAVVRIQMGLLLSGQLRPLWEQVFCSHSDWFPERKGLLLLHMHMHRVVKQGRELDPAHCPLSQSSGPLASSGAGPWGEGTGLSCCWPPPLPSSRSTGLKRPCETRRASSSSRWRRTAPVSSGL